jgi:hypothetical protein
LRNKHKTKALLQDGDYFVTGKPRELWHMISSFADFYSLEKRRIRKLS